MRENRQIKMVRAKERRDFKGGFQGGRHRWLGKKSFRKKFYKKSVFQFKYSTRAFRVYDSIINRRFKMMRRLKGKSIVSKLQYQLAMKYQSLRWVSDFKLSRKIFKYKKAVWSLESQGLKRKTFKRRMSSYAVSLFDKQKLKYFYLGLSDHSLKNIVREVFLSRSNRIDSFVGILESRIITVLFRLNLSGNLKELKSYVRMGYFLINDKIISNINYRLMPGDVISLRSDFFKEFSERKKLIFKKRTSLFFYPTSYLEVSFCLLKFVFFKIPTLKEVPHFFNLNFGRVLLHFNNKGLR